MGIFGSKSLVWVPENEKLKEKILEAVGACDSCSNFDFSYNGLGDKEATTLAAALKRNFERNRKGNWGTIVKLNLSNNHIHALGIKALCDSLGGRTWMHSIQQSADPQLVTEHACRATQRSGP
ncbi:hypothetical protein T484DRAFT_1793796 [Baffinella frigidus]|nr:hypothetical protein T484DRAFT_1793796 [Cryptophyta sp. CCMP2293]